MPRSRKERIDKEQARELGERLRAHGETLDLSGAEIARQVGISARQYSTYATGVRTPDPFLLHRISAVLQVPMDELLPSNQDFRRDDASYDDASRVAHRNLTNAASDLEYQDVRWLAELTELMRKTRKDKSRRYKALPRSANKLIQAFEVLLPVFIRTHAPNELEIQFYRRATSDCWLAVVPTWHSRLDTSAIAAIEASFRRLAKRYVRAKDREIEIAAPDVNERRVFMKFHVRLADD